MRVVTQGLSGLTATELFALQEPIPFELSENCRRSLVIAEDFDAFRPLLQELHSNSRNGENPSIRRLIEALISTPFFLKMGSRTPIDLEIVDIASVKEKLTGKSFRDLQLLARPPVVPGMTREKLFSTRISPLLPATLKFVLLDRFFASQMAKPDFRTSGAYWFCRKVFENSPPLIRIISARKVNGVDVDAKLVEERLLQLIKEFQCESKVEVILGFTSHDRQLSFYFGKGRGTQSITLGAGTDVFRHNVLREGYAVVDLEPDTASANENNVISSHSAIRFSLQF
jgi:hypothetical protein